MSEWQFLNWKNIRSLIYLIFRTKEDLFSQRWHHARYLLHIAGEVVIWNAKVVSSCWVQLHKANIWLYWALLPPTNEVCEGYVFTGVCLSTRGGGACVVAPGGMHGCSGGGGHAWLLPGVCAWLLRGGMHGCSQGGCVVAPRGACVVALGGMRGFFRGGMHGFCWGACVVFFPGGACIGYDEIRSMSGRYASYWNAFLYFSDLYSKKNNTNLYRTGSHRPQLC